MPFFLSRNHGALHHGGVFGKWGQRFRRRSVSIATKATLVSTATAASATATTAVAAPRPVPVKRERSQHNTLTLSLEADESSTAENSVSTSTAALAVAAEGAEDSPRLTVSPGAISTSHLQDMVIQHFQSEPHVEFFPRHQYDHHQLNQSTRESFMSSTVSAISEPINIPSPLLKREDTKPYLEIEDFSQTAGAENSAWSTAFGALEERAPAPHLLKWEAVVNRVRAERELAGEGDKDVDSGSELESESDPDPDPEVDARSEGIEDIFGFGMDMEV